MGPGTTALSALSVPLNVHILRALEADDLPLAELSRATGHPPASTLRSYLRTLSELDVVERRREAGFPGSVDFAIAPPGEGLLRVAQVLQEWLRNAPDGPVALGSAAAKSAIKALTDGWSTRIVRAIAARPCALTELDRLIAEVSYPTLERRLTAMRQVGQLEARPNGARVTPYKATGWLRQAVAPLVAAIDWERRWAAGGDANPLGRVDVEAIFLLAMPLLHLPGEFSGTCRLAVEFRSEAGESYAGVVVVIEEGKPVSCVSRLGEHADAWAVGSPLDWCGWLNRREDQRLEFGGEYSLAIAVAEALQTALVPDRRVQLSH